MKAKVKPIKLKRPSHYKYTKIAIRGSHRMHLSDSMQEL